MSDDPYSNRDPDLPRDGAVFYGPNGERYSFVNGVWQNMDTGEQVAPVYEPVQRTPSGDLPPPPLGPGPPTPPRTPTTPTPTPTTGSTGPPQTGGVLPRYPLTAGLGPGMYAGLAEQIAAQNARQPAYRTDTFGASEEADHARRWDFSNRSDSYDPRTETPGTNPFASGNTAYPVADSGGVGSGSGLLDWAARIFPPQPSHRTGGEAMPVNQIRRPGTGLLYTDPNQPQAAQAPTQPQTAYTPPPPNNAGMYPQAPVAGMDAFRFQNAAPGSQANTFNQFANQYGPKVAGNFLETVGNQPGGLIPQLYGQAAGTPGLASGMISNYSAGGGGKGYGMGSLTGPAWMQQFANIPGFANSPFAAYAARMAGPQSGFRMVMKPGEAAQMGATADPRYAGQYSVPIPGG